MLNLALRNLLRQKTRSSMILAAIAFGVASLLLIGGFIQDMFGQLADATIHSQTGHIQIALPGYFGSTSRSPEKLLLPDIAPLKEKILRVNSVRDVMARISFSGLLSNGHTDFPIVGEGIEPEQEMRLGSFMVIKAGRKLRSDDAYGILIGEGVANSLKLAPDDRVNVVVATVDGAMNVLDFSVVGVFQSFSRDYDARAIKIPLAAAQELLGTAGANVLVLALERTRDVPATATVLRADRAFASLAIRTWDEINDFYAKAVTLYERQFGVLRLIVLVMVILSVSNVVNMSVGERVGEFGTMRALGNRDKDVFLAVMSEGLLLGASGALLGCALGFGLAWAISSIGIPMPPPPNSNLEYVARIRIAPAMLIAPVAIGVLATIVASIVPARRAATLTIVEALRRLI
jgi:putative ABC transport system permease protein